MAAPSPHARTLPGHVFVINGDLTRVACDAWLLPTDEAFNVTDAFGRCVGLPGGGSLASQLPRWGTERVRLHGATSARPAIWLGNIGAFGRDTAWYLEAIEEFIREAAAAAVPSAGRPPLLAVNLVGTGDGGLEHSKGALLVSLFTHLSDYAATHHADVVVVTRGQRAYSAAQRARLRALGGDLRTAAAQWKFAHNDSRLHDKAEELADSARRGKLSMFLGAGVSAGAGLPSWSELLKRLNNRLGHKDLRQPDLGKLDPRDQATLLERRFQAAGRRIGDSVRDELGGDTYALQHGLLASLPVSEVVTTNFDTQFEAAVVEQDERLAVLPYAPDQKARRWLLKLHGTLTEPDSIVFTRSSYIQAPRERGALIGLVQAMLLTRHMVFAGYSLRDEDFHQLVHDVRLAVPLDVHPRPLGTAIALFDDPVYARLWSDDVELIAVHPECQAPSDADKAVAAREVERFFDLVGFLASDMSRFVLDPTYEGLLEDDEKALRKLLHELSPDVSPQDERPGWDKLAALLGALGRDNE